MSTCFYDDQRFTNANANAIELVIVFCQFIALLFRASTIVMVVSAAALSEVASTAGVASLYFQCECMWAVRFAKGALQSVTADGRQTQVGT